MRNDILGGKMGTERGERGGVREGEGEGEGGRGEGGGGGSPHCAWLGKPWTSIPQLAACALYTKNVSPFDKNASAMKTFPLKISYKTVIFSIFWYPFVLFTLLPFLLCVLSAPLLIAICSSTQIFSFFLLPCLFFLLHFAMFSLCYLRPSCLLYALTVQVTASSCYSLSTSLRCHYCFYNFLTVWGSIGCMLGEMLYFKSI